MKASERIQQWNDVTPDYRRKEIYENLLGNPDFSDFLGLMKEQQSAALESARVAVDDHDIRHFLGSASGIDGLIRDMIEVGAVRVEE